jgi:hypothetical protein
MYVGVFLRLLKNSQCFCVQHSEFVFLMEEICVACGLRAECLGIMLIKFIFNLLTCAGQVRVNSAPRHIIICEITQASFPDKNAV